TERQMLFERDADPRLVVASLAQRLLEGSAKALLERPAAQQEVVAGLAQQLLKSLVRTSQASQRRCPCRGLGIELGQVGLEHDARPGVPLWQLFPQPVEQLRFPDPV